MFESAKPPAMRRVTRCALFGVAMTAIARIGPWSWPGWPAVTLLDFILARYTPSVVPPLLHALGIVLLFTVNTVFWALVAWLALALRDAVWRR